MSNKILRLSDRIKLDIGGVIFTLAPLNRFHKLSLSNCTTIKNGEEHYDLSSAQALYIKHAVKNVEGLTGYNDVPYELEFDGDQLTEDCVSEILSLDQRTKLTTSAWQLLNGIKELTDLETGEKMEGVTLEVVPGGK